MSQPHDEWFHKLAMLRIDMLSEAECSDLEEHIQSCALCQEHCAQYRVVDENLRRYFSLPVLPAEPPPLPDSLQRRALATQARQARYGLASMKQFIAAFGMQSVIISLSMGLIIFILGIYFMHDSSANFALVAPLADIAIAAVILGLVMRRGLVLREEWNNSGSGRHYFSAPSHPLQASSQAEDVSAPSDLDPSLHDPLPALKHTTHEKLWHDRGRLFMLSLTLLAVGLASLSISLFSHPVDKGPAAGTTITTMQTSGPTISPTGISSIGDKVFDTDRKDVDLKQAAAAYVSHGNISLALQQWQQALLVDSDDAEVLIYQQNQQVSAEVAAAPNRFESRTLVVFTTLTQDHIGGGRDILQGAYVAQKEYNDHVFQTGRGTLLRLMIAVTNKDEASIRRVTLQVVQAAKNDPSILGVMGLPTSGIAAIARPLLDAAHLPMISPTASSVDLSGKSPYFFRIAPPDTVQGRVGAEYAKDQLHVKTVAVFVNDGDPYSRSLAQAFEDGFADPQHSVIQLYYQEGQPETIEAGFKRAEQMAKKPDLIYFAGFVNDASVLLQLLPPCSQANDCLKVMGGDALYVQRDYSLDAYKSYSRLIFTAFAFYSTWEKQGVAQQPHFFQEYAQDFDPSGQYRPGKYGFNRADADAILAYDAMQAFLHAFTQLSEQQRALTPTTLLQMLQQLDASHAFQGVSRKIGFDANGNPVDNQVVVLAGTADAQTNLVDIYRGTTK